MEEEVEAAEEESQCPTQDEINESIVIEWKVLEFERSTFVRGEQRMITEKESGVEAVLERKQIAKARTSEELFKKLRKMAAELCSPRIFWVSDHGNVTEYSYSGEVIGGWV
jgi:hypothetical protein